MSDERPKVVTIGGGTGSFVLLSGLKRYVRDLTAIVTMSDDGGSTGILRDELGVLPPGDVRQCLVALAQWPRLRDLFNYRFEEGTFAGHSFGNLFLTALAKVTGSFEDAVEEASKILSVQGTVVPVTTHNVRLVARLADGMILAGEATVAGSSLPRGAFQLALEPAPTLNPNAERAILDADLIVVCPGSLYTSVIPHFLVDGMAKAIRSSAATKVFVVSLMNKANHTGGFWVHDHVGEVERHAGGRIFDYVVFNTATPPAQVLARYREEGDPVPYDERGMAAAGYTAIPGDFLAPGLAEVARTDLLRRTLIRHDPDRTARMLMQLYWRSAGR